MTLLRLSPEGERLRRIAKAHAAGELSTLDYRRIRGDVIEGFANAPADGDVTGDATQPRWLDHGTARPKRKDRTHAAPITAPVRPRIVWLALAMLLLAVLFAAAAAWSRDVAPIDDPGVSRAALLGDTYAS